MRATNARGWRHAAAAVLLLSAAPALAEEPLRKGEEAFGDWSSDAPGVRRLILPQDLPKPYATKSIYNAPNTLHRPEGYLPKAPPGFAVDLIAEKLRQPRVLRTAPNGDVFLAESGAGAVRVLRFGAGGEATSAVFAKDLPSVYGIAFPPGADPRWIYFATTEKVLRFPYHTGDLTASGPPQTLVEGMPTGGHWTRDLAFSADGATLFVALGSRTNDHRRDETKDANDPDPDAGRAVVLAFDPEGGRRRVYASGLRNCSGLATQPATGALWCVVNERDGFGDNLMPDFATRVLEGQFYGWPWFYIGDHRDPIHKGERPDFSGRVATPEVLLQTHSAPLGLAFYTGAAFPREYRGDAFVTMHGSWNRTRRTGYKVVRLRMNDGAPTGEYDDFLTGFVLDDKNIYGRPVGVAVTKDGALLVSDDGAGAIWRVRYIGE